MDEIIKLKTVDIKSLSRKQLEAAYHRLLRVGSLLNGNLAAAEVRKDTDTPSGGADRVSIKGFVMGCVGPSWRLTACGYGRAQVFSNYNSQNGNYYS